MSVTIQVKRGTEAQIQAATLAIGELAFATDTKSVLTYDGVAKQLVGRALYNTLANRPTYGIAGRLFMDSGTGALYMDSGSSWLLVTPDATSTPTASKIPIADGSGKLDGWVSLSSKASTDHDATHITGGSDEIDGDKLDIDWNPSNYTPSTVESYANSVDNLTAHLKGIDTAIGSVSVSDEVVQDLVGAMLSSNVETGVSLTYDDSNAKIDAYVTPYDVVGGRLDLVSATSIKWGFQDSAQIRLWDSEKWALVTASAEPTIANIALDMSETALAPNTIYDVFAEYDSSTAFDLVLSRWATGGDGANNSSTSYATPVMNANNAPGPVVVSADSEAFSHYAWKALNQTVADSADDWCSSNTPLPHWLKIDMGVPVCINRYAMRAYNYEVNNPNFFPANFTLSGSNDDSTYTTLDTRTGISFPGTAAWTSYFNFLNSQAYRYYKLNVTAITGGSDYVVIGELKLVAASNSLAGGSSRVRAYESTVTYSIGDRVTYGSPTHYWVKISTAAAGTTPVAGSDWVDNGLAADVGSSDFAGLYRHDGVLVSDSSTTGKSRRWLGVIYTYSNSGTVNFKDDINYRYISNFYNRTGKTGTAYNSNSSYYVFSNTSWRENNNGSGTVRFRFVTCYTQNLLASLSACANSSAAGNAVTLGIGLNSTTPSSYGAINSTANGYTFSLAQTIATSVFGYNWFTYSEYTNAGTGAVFTDNYTKVLSTIQG